MCTGTPFAGRPGPPPVSPKGDTGGQPLPDIDPVLTGSDNIFSNFARDKVASARRDAATQTLINQETRRKKERKAVKNRSASTPRRSQAERLFGNTTSSGGLLVSEPLGTQKTLLGW